MKCFYRFSRLAGVHVFFMIVFFVLHACSCKSNHRIASRERISLNNGWRFYKYASPDDTDSLMYDLRPKVAEHDDGKAADSKPTEAVYLESNQAVLKPWIMPAGNKFIRDYENRYTRPDGNPGEDFPFVQTHFDDHGWEKIDLPHDWAIKGPFFEGENPEVGGGMGRLPSNGVAWYRQKFEIAEADMRKSIFLDFEGVMSYAMVWCNGKLVGGWPYGYNSWRVNLMPYIVEGVNQLAVRVDNPNYSARWYPGAGIYRDVWLTKTNPVHVSHWGTSIITNDVSAESAQIELTVSIDNDLADDVEVAVFTEIFELDANGKRKGDVVARSKEQAVFLEKQESIKLTGVVEIKNPNLWGPLSTQKPNRYVAVTKVIREGESVDQYETRFGIRSLTFDPDKGLVVNGEHISIRGVNLHHDLGALGVAFNRRAAERQLEILRNMGCNAIRMAHNPPAPALLELTDRMGFLVMDEIFDSWEQKKTPHDFHLIFPDWAEQDARAFIRRDRNHPSVIMWSFGNEVGEQYTSAEGAAIGQKLFDILKEEDPTRPATTAMNFAKSFMELPKVPDIIGLNYQGEGIRQDSMFIGTERIRTVPQYDLFHERFPNKVIVSTETASTLSTRGTYIFPVSDQVSSPVRENRGGDPKNGFVSAYEMYAVDFGSSPDKVFASLDKHPFVAGEFVWTGFDYIGEPTPYYSARSSYSGIIDLAGFPKDRYYLYQSRWRPDLPMVHILPHWNWPDRVGKITPVHVFTSGDEAELFLNNQSLGRKKKGQYDYRLRWDSVLYEPGALNVVAYKNGQKWAEKTVQTTGEPYSLILSPDRSSINADRRDLCFLTVKVVDESGLVVPNSMNPISFSLKGSGKIIATDNGDPTDMKPFPSLNRNAFNGMALVIIQSTNEAGSIKVQASSPGLTQAEVVVHSNK